MANMDMANGSPWVVSSRENTVDLSTKTAQFVPWCSLVIECIARVHLRHTSVSSALKAKFMA